LAAILISVLAVFEAATLIIVSNARSMIDTIIIKAPWSFFRIDVVLIMV
jgi:hypothetical protein